eukprot:TRINITY_DN5582_c0_g1_i1.p1 TRINITY_DN5582_c0_g1~~TRINITY_DN5582_c0_g1_i1.p1  ORF type:complete len:267 (+),score=59.18 TRINITY_DN5582_c0_g1_i1:102-902(+)
MSDIVSDLTLSKIQAGTGLIFGTYLTLHLANALSANLGPAAYDAVQTALRPFYQNALVEPVVIFGTLAVHTAAAVVRIVRRRARSIKKDDDADSHAARAGRGSTLTRFWRWARLNEPAFLHRYTGYFLTAVIGGHIAAVRLAPMASGFPASFANVAFAIKEISPVVFYPYYVLFPTFALYHMMYGGWRANNILLGPAFTPAWFSPRSKAFKLAVAAGFVGFIGGVLVFGGIRYGPVVTTAFDRIKIEQEQFLPTFLHPLLPWKRAQ